MDTRKLSGIPRGDLAPVGTRVDSASSSTLYIVYSSIQFYTLYTLYRPTSVCEFHLPSVSSGCGVRRALSSRALAPRHGAQPCTDNQHREITSWCALC
ncbi:hypothetical protein ElyMa_000595500 [Elysia marginata]|uniref:Uncharacterized protein n=1 Tax=Elysia marginata TaxID=1093978 RepID=A0AAV4G7U8_9GAST|nr:hypothetical protein ElyMa_000595500 [Elysia marginata]